MANGSEEYLRLIVDSFGDALSLHDAAGRFVWVGHLFHRLTGLEPDAVLGREGVERAHPEDREQLRQVLTGAIPEERAITVRWLAPAGEVLAPLPVRARSVRDAAGRTFRLLLRAERREGVGEPPGLLAALLAGIPEGVYVTDREGCYRLVNAAAARLLGRSAEEMAGKRPDELFDAPTAQSLRQGDCRTLEREQVATEEEEWPLGGAARTLVVTRGPYRDAEGRVAGVFAFLRDVTADRALTGRLREAQKLEAVGQLAGGIAHHFNNLLTVITGYSDLLLSGGPPPALEEPLREIHRAAEQAAGLTRQLLAFGRRQRLTPAVFDLNAAIADLEGVLRRLLGDPIPLTLDLGPDLWPVQADRAQVEQVLLSLAANAREALPGGGAVTIATRNRTLDPAGSPLPVEGAARYAEVVVRDTGPGMDEATRARVFEPFFSTRGIGRSRGLGLAAAYGIVRQSGGHIEVTSTPGQGSTFTVYLPAAPPAEEAGPAGTTPAGTILVAEGDPAIRALVRHILEREGYRVLEARHSQEALQVYARHAGAVDLLIADLFAPHLSGPELARLLLEQDARLGVVFVSASPREHPAFDQPILGRRPRFLAKPFRPADLLHVVREALPTRGA